jgi:hypothetical protein
VEAVAWVCVGIWFSTHEGEVRVLESVNYLDSMLQTKSMVPFQRLGPLI